MPLKRIIHIFIILLFIGWFQDECKSYSLFPQAQAQESPHPYAAQEVINLEDPTPSTSPLASDGIHDPGNVAIRLLQNPADAVIGFPMDRQGVVDWMAALNGGFINPRAEREGSTRMETMDQDIVMTNTKTMPHVRFPHLSHTKWLTCSNCHPDIFKPRLAGNAINMNAIFRGQYCGACHGRVAFSIYVCERCHSVLHKDSPDKWW